MSSFQKEMTGLLSATMSIALILTNLALAQAQITVTQTGQPNRVSIEICSAHQFDFSKSLRPLKGPSRLREGSRDTKSTAPA